jgi:single-strand DNA-binding protein
MANFNRVILLGRLTRDIELRYVGASNTAVTDVGLAVSDKRKNAQGEWVEETTFVDITLWGRTAEVASEYLSKGQPVLIEGRLKLDSWEGQDGQKRSKLRVVGERMQLLPKGTGGGGGGRGARSHDENEYSEPVDDFGEPAHAAAASSGGAKQEGDIPF